MVALLDLMAVLAALVVVTVAVGTEVGTDERDKISQGFLLSKYSLKLNN